MKKPLYVALGDSISIDDYPDLDSGGKNRGFPSLLYKNNDEVYPEFKGKDLVHLFPGMQMKNLAFDGATIEDLLSIQLPKVPAGEEQPIIITITILGNNLLESIENAPNRKEINLDSFLFSVDSQYKLLAQCIRYLENPRVFPEDIKILIGNIYDSSDTMMNLDFLEQIPDIKNKGNEIIKKYNNMIKEIAEEHNLIYVDIYKHFLGHSENHNNSNNPHYCKEDPSLWYYNVVEPSARGAHELRKIFLDAINRH